MESGVALSKRKWRRGGSYVGGSVDCDLLPRRLYPYPRDEWERKSRNPFQKYTTTSPSLDKRIMISRLGERARRSRISTSSMSRLVCGYYTVSLEARVSLFNGRL